MDFKQAAEIEANTPITVGAGDTVWSRRIVELVELCRRSYGFVRLRLDGRTDDIDVKELEALERDLRAALPSK